MHLTAGNRFLGEAYLALKTLSVLSGDSCQKVLVTSGTTQGLNILR